MNDRLAYGVGIYKKGKNPASISGRPTKPYYTWRNMLERCYDSKCQEKYPTYIGCSVCDEWLNFQVFAEWYETNHPKDCNKYHLDKDLKALGNKVYSPETCLFVPTAVNLFTTDSSAARGSCMIGVTWYKPTEKFMSYCKNPFTKKQENLGHFHNELQAHLAWRKRKSELAYELAMIQENQEVRDALLRWRDALDANLIHQY